MQEQVSRAIVAALQMKLTVAEDHQLSCRPIRNAGIFDLYLRARKGILQATKEGLGAAVRLLEDGLRMDPDTALLVAGLGYAHVQTATFGFAQDEALEKASTLATHALQLDPEMAQAHLVLGLVACHHGDHRKSVRELGLAISLEPAESDSLYWLGIEYVCVGRTAAVAPVIDRMRAVDPLHPYLDSLGLGHIGSKDASTKPQASRSGAGRDTITTRLLGSSQHSCLCAPAKAMPRSRCWILSPKPLHTTSRFQRANSSGWPCARRQQPCQHCSAGNSSIGPDGTWPFRTLWRPAI